MPCVSSRKGTVQLERIEPCDQVRSLLGSQVGEDCLGNQRVFSLVHLIDFRPENTDSLSLCSFQDDVRAALTEQEFAVNAFCIRHYYPHCKLVVDLQ